MALFKNVFNQVTVAPEANVYTNWAYNPAIDRGDTGPNYISAYWVVAPDNYGTMTTVQTSINSFYTEQAGFYGPGFGISYSAVMRNDTTFPAMIKVSIGNFQ